MLPLNNWMSLAVRALAMVVLVLSLPWTVIGGLGVAQAPLAGFLWIDGADVTDGIIWSD
jgi:hypothetical protein